MLTNAITAVMIIAIAFAGMLGADIRTNGQIVADFGMPLFQLNGVFFGGVSDHEQGHLEQQRSRGNREYYATVAVPSVAGNICDVISYLVLRDEWDRTAYHRLPWEAEADRLGAHKE